MEISTKELHKNAKWVFSSMWAFKRKWKPDRTTHKYKARFCVRGIVQKREASEPLNTHSPVVVWSTVKLVLILAWILGINSHSIYFYYTYVQADIPKVKDVYIEFLQVSLCANRSTRAVVQKAQNRTRSKRLQEEWGWSMPLYFQESYPHCIYGWLFVMCPVTVRYCRSC